ncbi:hypothetical protein BGW38_005423 [Lunasporangiospora selenospora]|uniref:Uncharacterized protein n=1 Tax=Lunasporangiospora selenospora TaxID=979761 RepID=A0A9P6FN09_9FUNG|nr:hypothetical protein BGW38_005423 [Lunasporangiospora selenospora]
MTQAFADLTWTQLDANQTCFAGQRAQELTGQYFTQDVGGCIVQIVGTEYECSSTGHRFSAYCYATVWLKEKKPPGGVPSVSTFYCNQCTSACNDPRDCKFLIGDNENQDIIEGAVQIVGGCFSSV